MRRFILVNQEKPDQAIGEGVVWSNDRDVGASFPISIRWFEPQLHLGHDFTLEVYKSMEDLFSKEHYPSGALKVLWIDPYWDAPYTITRSTNGGPYVDATQFPSHRLHDGWGKPNGVVDSKGTPLHVGQQVRLINYATNLACYGEATTDVGEIFALTINEHGKLRIGLAGVNCCNMADVDLAEIEAIETTTKQTWDRNGGQKPSWSFVPTITLSSKDEDRSTC